MFLLIVSMILWVKVLLVTNYMIQLDKYFDKLTRSKLD